jgi:tetratricopeptide (TPR) repeat protein
LTWILHDNLWGRLSTSFPGLSASRLDDAHCRLLTARGAQTFYVESKDLSLLLDAIDVFNHDTNARQRFYLNLNRRPGFDDALQTPGFARQLAKIVLQEREPRLRDTVLSQSGFLDALWISGQFDELVDLASDGVAKGSRSHACLVGSIRRSIEGAILREDLVTAVTRLKALSRIQPDHANIVLLLRVAGELSSRIADQQTLLAQATDRSEASAPRQDLLRLLRAAEDKEAVSLAKQLDPSLAWFVAVEQFDWKAASELPPPRFTSTATAERQQLIADCIEYTLGSLLGQSEIKDACRVRILKWLDQNSDQPEATQIACDTLVANEVPATAFQLIKAHIPEDSCYWFTFEQDTAAAMEIVRREEDNLDGLFDRLAQHMNFPSPQRVTAASHLLRMGVELNRQGDSGIWKSILRTLARYPQRVKLNRSTSDRYLARLARQLYDAGQKQRAWQLIATASGNAGTGFFLQSVYADPRFPTLAAEAESWWKISVQTHPRDSPLERLQQVDRILTGKAAEQEIRKWVFEPFQISNSNTLSGLFGGSSGPVATAFRPLVTLARYDLIDEYLQRVDEEEPFSKDALILFGRQAMKKSKFVEAAQYFQRAWRWQPRYPGPGPRRSSDPFCLYMAGICLEHVDPARAEATKVRARQLAFSNDAAHAFADRLCEEGLPEQAGQIYRDLVLSTPQRHANYMDLVSSAAKCSRDSDCSRHWNLLRIFHLGADGN